MITIALPDRYSPRKCSPPLWTAVRRVPRRMWVAATITRSQTRMLNNSVPRRSKKQTAIAIVLTNVLVLPAVIVLRIIALPLGVAFDVLSSYVVLSAGLVSLAYVPDRSSGWRSVLAAMALAVITEAAVLAIYIHLSDARTPGTIEFSYEEAVLFFVGIYSCAVVVFYLIGMLQKDPSK